MTDRYSTALRNVAILASIIFLVLLTVAPSLLSTILPTQGNDAETVAQLSTTTVEADAFDGYGVVALIYAHVSDTVRILIILGLGIALILALFWYIRLPRTLFLAGFCLLPALLLYLPLFTKDTFVTPLVIAAFTLLVSDRITNGYKISIITILYCIFGFAFRSYYIIIAGVWLGLLIFISVPARWRIVLIVLLPLLLLAIPADVYDTLQSQRDTVNYARVGMAGAGFRTAFMNLLDPKGLPTFAVNYAYAAYRLNLPVLSPGVGVKEFFLFLVLCVYGWLAATGLRSGNQRISWAAGLFFAHVLVQNIFEPDLGSYLRHLSTAMLLLAPSLIMRDRLWQNRMSHSTPPDPAPVAGLVVPTRAR